MVLFDSLLILICSYCLLCKLFEVLLQLLSDSSCFALRESPLSFSTGASIT